MTDNNWADSKPREILNDLQALRSEIAASVGGGPPNLGQQIAAMVGEKLSAWSRRVRDESLVTPVYDDEFGTLMVELSYSSYLYDVLTSNYCRGCYYSSEGKYCGMGRPLSLDCMDYTPMEGV
jgi:hypothetical protein